MKAVNPGAYDDAAQSGHDRGVDEETVRKVIRPLANALLGGTGAPDIALDRLRAFVSLDMTRKYGLQSKNGTKSR